MVVWGGFRVKEEGKGGRGVQDDTLLLLVLRYIACAAELDDDAAVQQPSRDGIGRGNEMSHQGNLISITPKSPNPFTGPGLWLHLMGATLLAT
jgi:hypothetical protein